MHTIFSFEPMNLFHISVLKMSKEFALKGLGSLHLKRNQDLQEQEEKHRLQFGRKVIVQLKNICLAQKNSEGYDGASST